MTGSEPDSGSSDSVAKYHALMLLATALIAMSFPVGAAITHHLDPLVLTLLRFALAAMLFLPYVAWRHGLPWPGLKGIVRYSIISAGLVGFFSAMFEALRHTSVLNTATIFTLNPAITALVAGILLKERLQSSARIALPVGIVGAIWVIFRGDMSALLALDLGKGDVIFFLGCIGLGSYMPILKFLHRGEPMAQITFWTLTTGAGWLLILAAPNLGDVVWDDIPGKVWGGIAFLAVFTTLITFFIFQSSVAVIGPTKVSSYTYLNPAFVLLIGLGFGETLPPLIVWPGVLVVAGATFILQRGR